jgi:hypothetical protein
MDAGDASNYGPRLSAFIDALRSEFRPYHEALPVVMALMSTDERGQQYPYIYQVRRAQNGVADETPGVVTVDMGGYEHYHQDMGFGRQWSHLTKAGQCGMGAGMADAWMASGLA